MFAPKAPLYEEGAWAELRPAPTVKIGGASKNCKREFQKYI